MATDQIITWGAGKIIGVNNIGAVGGQIIGVNSKRAGIRFHNPGTATIYVYSLNTLPAPTLSSPGGAFLLFAQNDITIYGGNVGVQHDVNGAWGAFSAGGSNQPLTIMEFS